MDFLGVPPINRAAFIAGKAALVGCWCAFGVRALHPAMAWFQHGALSLASLLLLAVGSLILLVALADLGAATRVGLPREKTTLKTQGLYRFTRNPMYVGLHLTCLAAVLWAAQPLVLLLFGVSVWVHHAIVKAEERFLEERFGDAWRAYAARVRRYL